MKTFLFTKEHLAKIVEVIVHHFNIDIIEAIDLYTYLEKEKFRMARHTLYENSTASRSRPHFYQSQNINDIPNPSFSLIKMNYIALHLNCFVKPGIRFLDTLYEVGKWGTHNTILIQLPSFNKHHFEADKYLNDLQGYLDSFTVGESS